MGTVRKIDIAVREELANEMDAAVASGEFETINDVVAAALKAWKAERAPLDRDDILRLRRLWEEGIASGAPIAGNFDLADIKRRAVDNVTAASRARA